MKIIFSILFIIFSQVTECQNAFNKISESAGLLSFEDLSKPGMELFGTGTILIKYMNSDKTSAAAFLITNKHVLPTAKQNRYVHFLIRDDSSANGFVNVVFEVYEKDSSLNSEIKLDPDSNDLAVVNLTNYFMEKPKIQHLLSHCLNYNQLLDRSALDSNEISLGSDIVFLGYPNALFDKRNFSPIARLGIISSLPNRDFYFSDEYRYSLYYKAHIFIPEKLNGFLVDATATGGSSGSLVISKPRFFKVQNKQIKYYSDPNGQIFVLGILTESFFDLDSRITGNQWTHIAGVITAEQIKKTIDLFDAEFK